MQEEVAVYFGAMGWALMGAAGIFLLSVILSLVLRKRFAPGLVPGLTEPDGDTILPRALSLIGMGAAPRQTLGEVRLRTSLGLRLLMPAALVLGFWFAVQMREQVVSLASVLLLMLAWQALHVWLYEIRFDRETISLPRWTLGHRTFAWKDLEAVTQRDAWFMTFHFRGAKRATAYKYVVGHGLLMETAQKALREV